MKKLLGATALVIASLVLGSGAVMAAPVTNLTLVGGCPHPENDPTCNNSGLATVTNVSVLLGVDESDVTFLGENSVGESSSLFSITFDNGAPPAQGDVGGTWTVNDTSITHLAFKANGYYILAQVDGLSGIWSTDIDDWSPNYLTLICPAGICNPDARLYEVGDFLDAEGLVAPLSSVTAYSVVPIPAAVWLFGSALAGLGWMRRKKTV